MISIEVEVEEGKLVLEARLEVVFIDTKLDVIVVRSGLAVYAEA